MSGYCASVTSLSMSSLGISIITPFTLHVTVDGGILVTLNERLNTGGSVSLLVDNRENCVLPSIVGGTKIDINEKYKETRKNTDELTIDNVKVC